MAEPKEKEFETLEGVEVEFEEFDQEKANNTMEDPKYDWSNKITDGKGEDA